MKFVVLRVCAPMVLALAAGANSAVAAHAGLLPTKPDTPPTTTAPPPSPPSSSPPTTHKPAPSEPVSARSPRLPAVSPRSGARTTAPLIAALRPLVENGMSATEAAMTGFGSFPVAGTANFCDTWMAPRYTPHLHVHKGTDIFAAAGTPVRAPFAGVVSVHRGGAGGLAVYVRGADGVTAYLAHLSTTEIASGQRVNHGDLVGTVGATGNAAGGAPHVHFEIHLRGAEVNPKPYLDRWLDEAIAAAPAVVAARLPARVTLQADAPPDESAIIDAVLRPLTPAALHGVLGLS